MTLQCYSAVAEQSHSCTLSASTQSPLHIRSSSENSDSGRQRVRCGSRSHPWVLEAQTGQKVNISLLDFSGHGRETQLDTRGLASDYCSPARVQYGYIVDKTNKKNVSICSTSAEHKHVYQSQGNLIEIVFMLEKLMKNGNGFLLAVEGAFYTQLSLFLYFYLSNFVKEYFQHLLGKKLSFAFTFTHMVNQSTLKKYAHKLVYAVLKPCATQ